MAPKRTLEQADANAQSAREPKQQKRADAANEEENQPPTDAEAEHESDWTDESDSEKTELHKELQKKKPEEYICVDVPRWAREGKSDEDDEDEDGNEDEDEVDEDDHEPSSHEASSTKMWPKPASEHPEWKWTMMWKSWQMLCDWSTRANYTIPDLFNMYITNDWHGYGMVELAENAMNEFNKEWTKKDGSLQTMWAPVAMLGFWLCNDNLEEVINVDDGERVDELVGVMGRMFITALHAIDRAGKLTKDSEFRDLGLVMAMYLDWSYGLGDYGLGEDDDVPWREHLVAYAQKADIDLRTVGLRSTGDVLDDLGEVETLEKSSKADRWDWRKTLKEYTTSHGIKNKIGGQHYDITKMSSRERAAHAFDHVDPLKGVPKEALMENRLQVQ